MPSNLRSVKDLPQFQKTLTQGWFIYDQLVSLDISQDTGSLQGSANLVKIHSQWQGNARLLIPCSEYIHIHLKFARQTSSKTFLLKVKY